MIHRAPFGSMERFTGILIEHFAGAFPTWLSPTQAIVLTISEKVDAYAKEVHKQLTAAGIRTDIDLAGDKIGGKIRRAREQKKIVIPGIEMFIEQAVRQFEIWTGESAPRSAMEKAAMEALQCKSQQ